MNPVYVALISMAGAFAYCLWGFLQAREAAKKTKQKEVFSWSKFVMTLLPTLVIGFIFGWFLTPSSAADFVSIIIAGYGNAEITSKVGINSFFDDPENP